VGLPFRAGPGIEGRNTMTTVSTLSVSLLAWSTPSFEMLLIAVVGASLPTAFFFWLKWWLGSVKDENPDKVIAEQAKADAEHAKHHGHGHGHGHDHDHDHGHGKGHHAAHA